MENAKRIILEKQENISIEHDKSRLIKRKRIYMKERFHYPATLKDHYKTDNSENLLIKNISLDREIKITQINLKNLSDNINFQMKKLKRCCVLETDETVSQNNQHIANYVTWNQNLRHKENKNKGDKKKLICNFRRRKFSRNSNELISKNRIKFYAKKTTRATITGLIDSSNIDHTCVMDNHNKYYSGRDHILCCDFGKHDCLAIQQTCPNNCALLPFIQSSAVCEERLLSNECKDCPQELCYQLIPKICRSCVIFGNCAHCSTVENHRKSYNKECNNITNEPMYSFGKNKYFSPLFCNMKNNFKKRIGTSHTATYKPRISPVWKAIENNYYFDQTCNNTKYKNKRSNKNGKECKTKLKNLKQYKKANEHIKETSNLYKNPSAILLNSVDRLNKLHTATHKRIHDINDAQYKKNIVSRPNPKSDKHRIFNGTNKTFLLQKNSKQNGSNALKQAPVSKTNGVKDIHVTKKPKVKLFSDMQQLNDIKTLLKAPKTNYKKTSVEHRNIRNTEITDNISKKPLLLNSEVVNSRSNAEEGLLQQNSSKRALDTDNRHEEIIRDTELINSQLIPPKVKVEPYPLSEKIFDSESQTVPEKSTTPIVDSKLNIFIANDPNIKSSFDQKKKELSSSLGKENSTESAHNRLYSSSSKTPYKSLHDVLKPETNMNEKKIEGDHTITNTFIDHSKPNDSLLTSSSSIISTHDQQNQIMNSFLKKKNKSESEFINLFPVSNKSEINTIGEKFKDDRKNSNISIASSSVAKKFSFDQQNEILNFYSSNEIKNESSYEDLYPKLSETTRNSLHEVLGTKIMNDMQPIYNDFDNGILFGQEHVTGSNLFNDLDFNSKSPLEENLILNSQQSMEHDQATDLKKEAISNVLKTNSFDQNRLISLNREKSNDYKKNDNDISYGNLSLNSQQSMEHGQATDLKKEVISNVLKTNSFDQNRPVSLNREKSNDYKKNDNDISHGNLSLNSQQSMEHGQATDLKKEVISNVLKTNSFDQNRPISLNREKSNGYKKNDNDISHGNLSAEEHTIVANLSSNSNDDFLSPTGDLILSSQQSIEHGHTIDLEKQEMSNMSKINSFAQNRLLSSNQNKVNNYKKSDSSLLENVSKVSISVTISPDKNENTESISNGNSEIYKKEKQKSEHFSTYDIPPLSSSRKNLPKNNSVLQISKTSNYNENYVTELKKLFSNPKHTLQRLKTKGQNHVKTSEKINLDKNFRYSTSYAHYKYKSDLKQTSQQTKSVKQYTQKIKAIKHQRKNICQNYCRHTVESKSMLEFICDVAPHGQSVPLFYGCPCMNDVYRSIALLCFKEYMWMQKSKN